MEELKPTDTDRKLLVSMMEKFELEELLAAVVAQCVKRKNMETAKSICNSLRSLSFWNTRVNNKG